MLYYGGDHVGPDALRELLGCHHAPRFAGIVHPHRHEHQVREAHDLLGVVWGCEACDQSVLFHA